LSPQSFNFLSSSGARAVTFSSSLASHKIRQKTALFVSTPTRKRPSLPLQKQDKMQPQKSNLESALPQIDARKGRDGDLFLERSSKQALHKRGVSNPAISSLTGLPELMGQTGPAFHTTPRPNKDTCARSTSAVSSRLLRLRLSPSNGSNNDTEACGRVFSAPFLGGESPTQVVTERSVQKKSFFVRADEMDPWTVFAPRKLHAARRRRRGRESSRGHVRSFSSGPVKRKMTGRENPVARRLRSSIAVVEHVSP